MEPTEVIEGMVYPFVEGNPRARLVREGLLHGTKEIACTWQGNRHRSQFPQNFVPLLGAGTPLGWGDTGQDFRKTIHSMGGQMDGEVHRINDPTEHEFDGPPRAVALSQLLEGDRLPPGWDIGVREWAEDIVNSMEEDPSDASAVGHLLCKGHEVVDEHVNVGEGPHGRWQGWVPGSGCSRASGCRGACREDITGSGRLNGGYRGSGLRVTGSGHRSAVYRGLSFEWRWRGDGGSQLIQRMRGRMLLAADPGICQVGDCFRCRGEDRRAVLPPHGEDEWEGD
jgi:hypothetical protein